MWGATPAPLPRRPDGGRWVDPSRRRRHALSARRRRPASRSSTVFVAPEDPVKLARADADQHVDGDAAPERVRLRRVVPGSAARRRAAVRRHRAGRRRPARCSRATPTTRSSASASRSGARPSRRARTPAIAPSSSDAIARSSAPAALFRERLAGRTGAGLDPCGALQIARRARAGRDRDASAFVLGQGRDRAHARRAGGALCLARRRRTRRSPPPSAAGTRRSAPSRSSTPGRFVRSDREPLAALPDAELPHLGAQRTLSAGRRVRLPRSAAGRAGAALRAAGICRAHLLRAASRQFVEGDVQHWWHPPSGRGTRTRCSDDLLWLPYAVATYVVADRRRVGARRRGAVPRGAAARARSGRDLHPAARVVGDARRSSSTASAPSTHAMQVRRARAAAHRLGRLERRHEPRRPRRPRRERVARLVPRHRARTSSRRSASAAGASDLAQRYRDEARWLTGMLELAWDGDWYRRAYFDDGTPLGSAQNEECKIDSLTQSWAVLSRAAQPRARRARDGRRPRASGAARRAARAAADAAVRSDGARSRATSRATCPASARTAASTRTPRCGR